MIDRINASQRSANMSRIRSKNTLIEMKVRRFLYHQGFRYRVNYSFLIGKPDIYLKKYKTVIFVNGCFWHQHSDCKFTARPKSNIDFWQEKLMKNIERDRITYKTLVNDGYNVIVVWECEIKVDFDKRMKQLTEEIKSYDVRRD